MNQKKNEKFLKDNPEFTSKLLNQKIRNRIKFIILNVFKLNCFFRNRSVLGYGNGLIKIFS